MKNQTGILINGLCYDIVYGQGSFLEFVTKILDFHFHTFQPKMHTLFVLPHRSSKICAFLVYLYFFRTVDILFTFLTIQHGNQED